MANTNIRYICNDIKVISTYWANGKEMDCLTYAREKVVKRNEDGTPKWDRLGAHYYFPYTLRRDTEKYGKNVSVHAGHKFYDDNSDIKRPIFSALSTKKISKLLNFKINKWEDGLKLMIKEMKL